MRDIVSNIGVVTAIAPAVLAVTTTGAALDLLGFGSAAFVITTGAVAGDGDFTAKVQDSDDGAAFDDVPADQLQGELPETLEANSVTKIGYAGFKRHVRLVVTKNGGTSIAASAVLVKGNAAERPVL
ncbi:hypothetical protein [Shinella zoogloeoides]|uniref:hypothetical protein n=1 Tax=Shinella zoogloeoides TaxID=352475 RepID=UPI0028AAA495|nr:hypothetical protein [Shinella zoogloeoides]